MRRYNYLVSHWPQGSSLYDWIKTKFLFSSSSFPILLGISPYESRGHFIERRKGKRREDKRQDSFREKVQQIGIKNEPIARQLFRDLTRAEVTEIGFVPHHSIEDLGCSPDGIVVLPNDIFTGLEIKTITQFGRIPFSKPKIHHVVQCGVSASCLNFPDWFLFYHKPDTGSYVFFHLKFKEGFMEYIETRFLKRFREDTLPLKLARSEKKNIVYDLSRLYSFNVVSIPGPDSGAGASSSTSACV